MVNGSVAMVEFLTFVDADEKNLVVMYVKILILNIIITPLRNFLRAGFLMLF